MRISTRSRYGTRLMINLAEKYHKGFSFLKDIAREECISEKYLSQIVIPLRVAGLLTGSRGASGGYVLAKSPSDITVKEIVEALEGDLCIIDCTLNENTCERSGSCVSKGIWDDLSLKITEFLNTITLEDLVRTKQKQAAESIEYVI
ncbi:MAG: Rrf2 family transcriptional regulator [Actinobacteria bacterium]|nr:Rrf2 family transcriptional regulator [Actinomycetota bacterium]MBM3709760.1 Rrf2 family transcriptional regulator [Actinomycetota bacterium]MBM3714018.1 Rrf2 family transcriptional regulator [Actinomycetota bacterium]